jgi:hypothetical protein
MTTGTESLRRQNRRGDPDASIVAVSPVPEITFLAHEPADDEYGGDEQNWAAVLLVLCLLGVSALYWTVNY